MDDTLKDIWEIADEMRAQGVKPDLLSVLTETQKRGLTLSSDNIRSVSERFPRSTTPVCPSYIPEFITAYLDGCSAKTILDPWAGVGTLLNCTNFQFHSRASYRHCLKSSRI